MIYYSQAKINIGLQILSKRENGFHDISTLMYPLPLKDIIELNPVVAGGDDFSLEQTGITVPGKPESNLIYKSWKLFSEACEKIPVRIHLHKQIPLGAGLGGGSSNATTILKGLNEISKKKLNKSDLLNLASTLGSDCSFFIESQPALAESRGEILTPYPPDLAGWHIIVLHPGIEISTAWAYQTTMPEAKRPHLRTFLSEPVENWKTRVLNDFETSVFKAYPVIAGLKAELYLAGATFTSMSGSGSSVYGLFDKKPELDPKLKKFLVWSGRL